jgi:hypothetical protein
MDEFDSLIYTLQHSNYYDNFRSAKLDSLEHTRMNLNSLPCVVRLNKCSL